jgi:endosialidase-like protein
VEASNHRSIKGETIMARLGMLLSSIAVLLQSMLATAAAGSENPVPPMAAPSTQHPLLVLEQNRASIVQRIVGEWAAELPGLPRDRRLSAEQLSEALWSLRSDRLLAASLAGSFTTIEALIADTRSENAVTSTHRVATKNLGDANADLTFTPINPCRIADTRVVGGALAANVQRQFDGFSANFATQGGTATNCGMPNGVAAIAMNVYAVNPTNLGFIKVWGANGTEPAVSTVNYQTGIVAIATGAIVPVDSANSNRFIAKSPAQVHFVADVVGFFKAPAGVIGDISGVTAGAGLTGGGTSGNVSVAIANAGVTAAMLAGNGCSNGQILKFNGANWVCSADSTGAGGGTVTSVATGTGLTGGPITASGTINLASTQLLPSVACSTNQIPKWNGSAWTCGTDNAGAANAFVQGGNAFGAIAKLGTLDNRFLDLYANNQPIGRFMPTALNAPNVALGFSVNGLASGVFGAIIGGGAPGGQNAMPPGFVSGAQCVLVYGCLNAVTDAYGTVAGGVGNIAGDGEAFGLVLDQAFATVGGGLSNWASGHSSTIGGGEHNTASGYGGAVGGGRGNSASGSESVVAGGFGNTAAGVGAVVAGGLGNQALGNNSFAGGYGATIPADAPGSFLWSDNTGPATLPAGAANQFIVASTNGIGMYTSKTFATGCFIGAGGGSWTCTSDRAMKADISAIEPRDVLARLVNMPIAQWRFIGEPETVRHIGPMAQDFRASFGLGHDDKGITGVDADGVALAAIQGLHQLIEDKDARIAALERAVDELRRALRALAPKH